MCKAVGRPRRGPRAAQPTDHRRPVTVLSTPTDKVTRPSGCREHSPAPFPFCGLVFLKMFVDCLLFVLRCTTQSSTISTIRSVPLWSAQSERHIGAYVSKGVSLWKINDASSPGKGLPVSIKVFRNFEDWLSAQSDVGGRLVEIHVACAIDSSTYFWPSQQNRRPWRRIRMAKGLTHRVLHGLKQQWASPGKATEDLRNSIFR